jgi:hypothetical protein
MFGCSSRGILPAAKSIREKERQKGKGRRQKEGRRIRQLSRFAFCLLPFAFRRRSSAAGYGITFVPPHVL